MGKVNLVAIAVWTHGKVDLFRSSTWQQEQQ